MATERLLMRHIREILRLKWTLRRSHRDTARSLGISAGAVASVVTRAKAMALTWDAIGTLSDDALERTLYGPKLALTVARPGPDLVWMHTELRRPGVTLELLHLEYLAAHPDGYRYSAFCGRYRRWLAQQRTSMRQVHTAGEKTFVDYAGQRPSLVDPTTGEIVPVELFVAVLGASNYTYAEASLTQRSVDFIQSHTRTVEYFGGVSAVVVPDQLRTGVVDPCRYEPRVQRTCGRLGAALASHVIANVTVVPGGILQPPSEGERRSWGIL
jgi:transposase